ncbi:ABC transporter permease [Xanthomonas theicola]|uniref:ABC transporter permease n=1 Tax=Xanthomonas theicola TaxID=56464 RepID=A0A2S6ZE90_9XANT|nr:FtsX-like permease family protein [Xanthomonas theicola]PPT90479.1 ABC transporter permease [Xanthomonas theicola]QNH23898.1 FtsX-like permease family protein [Xanthomonas theicola]
MDIRPILSTLQRHKTAAGLIVLEIALSCAVVSNARFLIGNRLERMQRPSGIDEAHLIAVKANAVARRDDAMAVTRTDLEALRAIPGVRSAAIVNMLPFGSSSWDSGIKLAPDQQDSTANAPNYMLGEDGLRTLGLNVVEGRDFNADEYVNTDGVSHDALRFPAVILSRALAQRLFPDDHAVGKSLYVFGAPPHRVVGVVERLVKPRDRGSDGGYDESMIFPGRASYAGGTYLLNVADPAQRETVLDAAKRKLSARGPVRIFKSKQNTTLELMRERYYRPDRAMAWLLAGVSMVLLLVTALGIVGLASFWVQQRTKQIGIRRALGATRGQILRYFQTENFLLASAGILLGMVLAYAINLWLMGKYELPRLPLSYLPFGAVSLWLLGQLAVLGPARRAAAVPPAVATRSA